MIKKASSKKLKTEFYTPKAKLAFIELRQPFSKTPILYHFDPESHIWIETNAFGYTICEMLCQLTLDNSNWYYPIDFFFQKMIPVQTQYHTHDDKFLAIVKASKTWCQKLERCQYVKTKTSQFSR